MLRTITILLSVLMHGALLIPLMGHEAGGRSFETGTGDDVLRIEQGIALEGISQLGQEPETVEAQEVVQLQESRAAKEMEQIDAVEPPPVEKPPIEEVEPVERTEPLELTDVITRAAATPEPDSVPVETPPDVEAIKPDEVKEIEPPPEVKIVKPDEVKEIEPQEKQVAAIEQVQQLAINEAKAASAKQSGGSATITTAYLGSLRARIEKNKINPRTRRRGTAIVRFKINADGQLVSREIKKSSGSKRLDKAALDAVDRAAPFPAFPKGVGIKTLTLTQPFKFKTR